LEALLWHTGYMVLDLGNLPDDPSLLRQMLLDLVGLLRDKDQTIKDLSHKISLLQRTAFGRGLDKVDKDQLRLAFAQLQGALAESGSPTIPDAPATEKAPRPKRKGHGRNNQPAHLPRIKDEHLVPEDKRTCATCSTPLEVIGHDVSETLEYVPATFVVRQRTVEKLACPKCHGTVVTGEPPARVVDRSVAEPGLMAQIATAKYADHMPLHRQAQIYARQGVVIAKETMCRWLRTLASLLLPLYHLMAEEIRAGKVIGTDDTPVAVLEEGRGKTKTGRVWVYVGDRAHPFTVFDYTDSRKRDGPMKFLENFTGYLQADAYSGYDPVYATNRVEEVACWAHARRKLAEAQEVDPVRASAGLAYVKALYKLEEQYADLSSEDRRKRRQAEAKPILDKFEKWLEATRAEVLPKGPMSKAIGYARGQWRALVRYVEDGDLSIDNNRSERALRAIAVGRNNWTFFGNDEGGRTAAVLYTFTATCKAHGIDPALYLRDVLARIGEHPASQARDLLPDRWKTLFAAEATAQLEALVVRAAQATAERAEAAERLASEDAAVA
jgi:transposase